MKQYDLLPRIKAEVERVSPGAEVIIYGSVARKEANEESDIDVLIIIDKEQLSPREEWNITDPLYDLNVESGVIISPQVYTRKEWYNTPVRTPYFINVMNEGLRL